MDKNFDYVEVKETFDSKRRQVSEKTMGQRITAGVAICAVVAGVFLGGYFLAPEIAEKKVMNDTFLEFTNDAWEEEYLFHYGADGSWIAWKYLDSAERMQVYYLKYQNEGEEYSYEDILDWAISNNKISTTVETRCKEELVELKEEVDNGEITYDDVIKKNPDYQKIK